MRPSWDWGHGKGDASSGTPGHTRELEDALRDTEPPEALDEDESFFQAGDEGRYEGGPALLMTEEPVELDEAPVVVVARTPEQDARRARLVRIVAMAVGAFAALFAFGVVKQRKADAQESPARVSANVDVAAQQTQRRDVTPHVVEAPAPAAVVVHQAAPEPEAKATEPEPAAVPAPIVEKEAKKPSVKPVAFAASLALEPSATAAKPVVTTTVTAVPQGQATGGGNVGNFASRGPGSDASHASMPTASFPVQ